MWTNCLETFPHHTIWSGLRFLHQLCWFSSPSMRSLQQPPRLLFNIHIPLLLIPTLYQSIFHFITLFSLWVRAYSHQPIISIAFVVKTFLSHVPHLSLHLFFYYSLSFPSMYQSPSIWQSNSCPLTSPITVDRWLFSVWCLFGDAD